MAPTILDLSLGAIEIGTLLTSVLYGISLVQTYIYCNSCQQDRLWLKVLVATVCFLETLHITLTWAYLYSLTVAEFGNITALLQPPNYFDFSITVQALAGTIAQAFFIWRIFLLTRKKWWLIAIPVLGALLKTIAAVMITVFSWRVDTLPVFQARYSYTVYILAISSVVTDVWNTAVLCFFLHLHTTEHSRSLVNRIIVWAIETGFLTSVAAILTVIFWTTMPNNGLWVSTVLIYSHLYSNSLLVSLNHRSSAQSPLSPHQPSSSIPSNSRAVMFTRSHTHKYDLSTPEDGLPTKQGHEEGIDAISMGDLAQKHIQGMPFK